MAENNLSDQDPNVNIRMEKRDGETYIALGLFIVALALPVLIGTYWAIQRSIRAAVVNAVCGGVLLLIGVIAIGYGRILMARSDEREVFKRG